MNQQNKEIRSAILNLPVDNENDLIVDGYAVVVANIVLKGRGLKTHEIPFNNKLKNAVMEYRNAIINKYGDSFNEDWFVFSTNGNPICEKTIRITIINSFYNINVIFFKK